MILVRVLSPMPIMHGLRLVAAREEEARRFSLVGLR
jgi:hypothetical protein